MQSRTHARTHASMPLKYTPPKPKNPFHKSKAKLSKQASSTSKTRLPPKKNAYSSLLLISSYTYTYPTHPTHPITYSTPPHNHLTI